MTTGEEAPKSQGERDLERMTREIEENLVRVTGAPISPEMRRDIVRGLRSALLLRPYNVDLV